MTDTAAFMSTQFLPRFIDAYRKHPCLWLMKSEEYCNRPLKTAAYKDLLRLAKTVVPRCDLNFIKKKIEILRGSFRRESRKVIKSMDGGSGMPSYRPKLWYYNLLLFLEDQEETGQSGGTAGDHGAQDTQEVDGFQEVEDDDEEMFEADGGYNPAAPTSLPKYNQHKGLRFEDEDAAASSLQDDHFLRNHEDEFDKFGTVVAAKLRRMTPLQDIFAEHLINQVLFHGLMDRLQESSVVDLRPPTL